MSVYRVSLELHSPLGTPLAADTLFGHLCWGLVYEQGPDVLSEFLRFMNGPTPPLVITEPAPVGHWPMPALPPPPPHVREQLIAETQLNGPWAGCDRVQAIDRLEVLSATRWVPDEVLRPTLGELSMRAILHGLVRWDKALPQPPRASPARRARINRFGIGDDGRAEVHDDWAFWVQAPAGYDLYVSSPWPADRIQTVFDQALSAGYGRDASIGLGHLRCVGVRGAELPAADAPNAVLSLGAFAPRTSDPIEGYWRLTTRMGKLGGPWALSEQIHKFPLLYLQGGAVLRSPRPPGVLGRMVHDVHPQRPEVQQYGLTLGLSVRLAD